MGPLRRMAVLALPLSWCPLGSSRSGVGVRIPFLLRAEHGSPPAPVTPGTHPRDSEAKDRIEGPRGPWQLRESLSQSKNRSRGQGSVPSPRGHLPQLALEAPAAVAHCVLFTPLSITGHLSSGHLLRVLKRLRMETQKCCCERGECGGSGGSSGDLSCSPQQLLCPGSFLSISCTTLHLYQQRTRVLFSPYSHQQCFPSVF